MSDAAEAAALGDCSAYLTAAFIYHGVCHIVGLYGRVQEVQTVPGDMGGIEILSNHGKLHLGKPKFCGVDSGRRCEGQKDRLPQVC